METVKMMNPTLWVFAAILISLVLVQSFLFYRLALKFNKKNNLVTREELDHCKRTGAIAAIGPALSSIIVALTLIAMVGSATTFMRCGVIGAPGWELLMASIASSAAGVELGTDAVTPGIFTFCIFCMILGSAPYFINCMVMLKPLDNAVEKSKEKKAKISFMPYLATSAMFGLMSYSVLDNCSNIQKLVAFITAGVSYVIFDKLGQKNKFFASMSMALAMIVGMVFGEITALAVGA
jgi:hypothetical protein